jgi:hypothetical protein
MGERDVTADRIRTCVLEAFQVRTGESVPRDAWENEIGIDIVVTEEICSVKLVSRGSDGQIGSDDDITETMKFRMD